MLGRLFGRCQGGLLWSRIIHQHEHVSRAGYPFQCGG